MIIIDVPQKWAFFFNWVQPLIHLSKSTIPRFGYTHFVMNRIKNEEVQSSFLTIHPKQAQNTG
jgi:hypothetical protein